MQKDQLLWKAVTNHFEGLEMQIYMFERIAENPLEYAKRQIQGIHGDLLLLAKNKDDIWPESIRFASLAARIMEIMTGEETPPKYAGKKWRSWDDEDQ